MSGQQLRSNKTIYSKILAIFLIVIPSYSAAVDCLWINEFCRSNDCPKYPDPDSALDVMTEDAWLFHTTNSGTCVYHNGAYGTPSSYQITSQTCENRAYSDLPSRCTRVVTFYYSDGALCSYDVEEAVVWSCEENQKQYIIKLEPSNGMPESQIILESIKPDEPTTFIAKVYDQNNQLVPNVGVKLALEAKQNSGGHHHPDDTVAARTGTMQGQQELTGNTESNGLPFIYKAPSVSGDYKIVASCTDGKHCTQEGPDTVWVGYKGLQPVGDSAVYRLIPNAAKDPRHPDNHYLTLTAASRLTVLATLYRAKYPDLAVLHLNDASLERGGIFDLSHNWKSPHFEHCRGAVIDVRANGAEGALDITSQTDPMIKRFQELTSITGASALWDIPKDKNKKRHWGLRHFHIQLMGQEGLQCP